jgi:uncharacterized protein (TIGR03032 family)
MSDKPVFVYGRTFLSFLASHNITIAISSYQSHNILAVGVQNVEIDPDLAIYLCPIQRCMGMSRYKNRLAISNIGNIMIYNSKGPTISTKYGKFTDEYQPRFQYHAADVDIHDLKITESGIYFVSATYNCIAMPSFEKTFEPYWIPPWIKPSIDGDKKYLRREDCCHLNGLCCVDGKPKYVTTTSKGNIAGHWRTHKSEGFIYDVENDEVVCDDIHSPHSPNWHNHKLWVLESGTGYFGYVDLDKKKFVKKVFLPGFLRGMTFFEKFAIVCLSKDRHDHAFHDLPLRENLRCHEASSVCGFRIIDTETFSVVEEFTFDDSFKVTELYDVICLPGYRSRILSSGEVDAMHHYDKLEMPTGDLPNSDVFDVSHCEEPMPIGPLLGQNSSISDDVVVVKETNNSENDDDDDPYFMAEPAILE